MSHATDPGAPVVEPDTKPAREPATEPRPVEEPGIPTFQPGQVPETNPVCPNGEPDEGGGGFETCFMPPR